MVSTKRPADPSAPSSSDQPVKKPRVGGFRVPAPANLPDGPWRRKAAKIKHELIVKSKIKKEYAKVKKAAESEQQQQQQQQPSRPKKDIFAAATAAAEEEQQPDRGVQDVGDATTKRSPAEDQPQQSPAAPAAEPEIHPDRIAMLDDDDDETAHPDVNGFLATPAGAAQAERAEARRRHRQEHLEHQRRRKPGYFAKELALAERKKAEAAARAAERERRERERAKAVKERERHRRILAKARGEGRKDGKRKLGKESIVMLDRVKRLIGQK